MKFILSDLDGVIRIYPPEHSRTIEAKFAIPPGVILKTAFERELLNRAVCGRITDEIWRIETACSLARTLGCQTTADAVISEWSAFCGTLDEAYLHFLKSRFGGVPLTLLTNGTTRLNRDLVKLGIRDRFDRIFNSAEIGSCKPDLKVYKYVINELGCEASDILFIDDSQAHINSARELGMMTHHYRSLDLFMRTFS
jgi:FMN phosphatase YigB (HAD superfamily)